MAICRSLYMRALFFAPPVLVMCLLATVTGCVAADPKENGSGVILTARASDGDVGKSAKPVGRLRAAVIERIARSALQTMSVSDDPIALVLSAKYVRDANVKNDEMRSEAQKDDLQLAALGRAKQLADKKNSGFVDFQIAILCLALPSKSACSSDDAVGAGDAVRAFAESDPSNITGWIIMAAREFSSSNNDIAQTYLEKAAESKTSNWFYKEATATAFRYTNAVVDAEINQGDAEAAAFAIAGAITLPPYKRVSQMCAPSPDGKLPSGRFEACDRIAAILVEHGQSNLEIMVGHKVSERLAIGKNNTAQAQTAARQYAALQSAIDYLWTEKMKFPPQTPPDGAGLVAYFADFIKYGEYRATQRAMMRFGKSTNDLSKD